MQKIGAAASLLIDQFDTQDLLKFHWAYERAAGKDESWTKAAASKLELARVAEWHDMDDLKVQDVTNTTWAIEL